MKYSTRFLGFVLGGLLALTSARADNLDLGEIAGKAALGVNQAPRADSSLRYKVRLLPSDNRTPGFLHYWVTIYRQKGEQELETANYAVEIDRSGMVFFVKRAVMPF